MPEQQPDLSGNPGGENLAKYRTGLFWFVFHEHLIEHIPRKCSFFIISSSLAISRRPYSLDKRISDTDLASRQTFRVTPELITANEFDSSIVYFTRLGFLTGTAAEHLTSWLSSIGCW